MHLPVLQGEQLTNTMLRSRRLARGWTQAELADLVCNEVERVTGSRPAVDAQTISRIECGEISWPRRATRQALVAVLEVESETLLGLFPKRTRRDAERDGATKRRDFLVIAGLAASVSDETSITRVGVADIAEMREKFARLVDLDSYLGGADTFRIYSTELARTERILSRTNSSSAVRKSLTTLASEQAQQAGWAAFDAGFTDVALQLFNYGRRAAEEADSRDLVANSLVHISYATGTAESSAAAESACAAISPDENAKARALLDSRRAWSYAVAGDRDGAARALDAARNALDGCADAAPSWCAWVDHGELDIMTGRAWSVLHRPDAAIRPLRRALDLYPDHWARDKSLYLTWLADAYLDEGDLENATAAVEEAFRLAAPVASVRPLARVRAVTRRCAATGSQQGHELARRVATVRPAVPTRL
ncbi:helix-turn-helix domain-containing protein [Nocardia takedensis]|uniref:helix-turn-helix domain-containing protein n=1 Tax=Nocardia takedensis TaxID=259390 RepID=UPI003F7771AD